MAARHVAYIRNRIATDPEFKAKHDARINRCHLRLKVQIVAAYGGKCACCGETLLELLTIDHTNGGGNKERKAGLKGGREMYRRLRKAGWPSGYRVLCFNCNCAMGLFGYCPHVGGSRLGLTK